MNKPDIEFFFNPKTELTVHHSGKRVHASFVAGQQAFALTFKSPEEIATFSVMLMEEASKVWPFHYLVQQYLSED